MRFTSVKATINLQSITLNSKTGDFTTSGLAQIINTETINNLIVQAWLDRACTHSDCQSRYYPLTSAPHPQQLTASRLWCFALMSPMSYDSQTFFESSELMLVIYTPIRRQVSGEHWSQISRLDAIPSWSTVVRHTRLCADNSVEYHAIEQRF